MTVALDREALRELAVVEAELNTRWPETKIDPSIERIGALVKLLGDPQRAYPVLQIAGTNGKTSTARMIDALLRSLGVRTGRLTSPHLQLVTERVSLDGAPIDPRRYVEAYRDIQPYLSIVDSASSIQLSKFEVLTAMAYATFADAPVDAGVVEVGMGGRWDATNVADADVAVLAPIDVDHVNYLGSDIRGIAGEKAGIVKANSVVIMGQQRAEVAEVILRRVAEVSATIARHGEEFGVLHRRVAVGGQQLALQGLGGVYDEIFLPLHGNHQAGNAALALAAVEAFFGAGVKRQLDIDAVRDGFAEVTSPGRLEPVRSAPTVLLDAAHNPHGARALAQAIDEEFAFRRLVGVVSIMADKNAAAIIEELQPVLSDIVITENSTSRAINSDELARIAMEIFGEQRVHVVPLLTDAIDTAIGLADEVCGPGQSPSGAGVLITGSVLTVGEARTIFGKDPL